MGLGFFIDLHLVVDEVLTVRQGHAIAHAVYNVLVHVELN